VKVLETARLTLRRLASADAGFIVELLNDPDFIRNIGDKGVRTLDDARAYIASGPVASYETFGFGLYRVELTASGTPIGICGLVKRETLVDVDLGFAFLPAFRSQGYALEAAAAVKRHAHRVVGLRRLVAITDPDNSRSIHLLAKIGFVYERMVKLSDAGASLKLFTVELGAADPTPS
jgi:ribosomal-protein-alanine N-acetyltransferase